MGSPSAATASLAMRANSPGSVTARVAASSKKARWLIWSRTAHPVAGVGVSQPASPNPATRVSRLRCSASRSPSRDASVTGFEATAARVERGRPDQTSVLLRTYLCVRNQPRFR